MNCLEYHTANCEGRGPHQADRNKPQGIRILPCADKVRGPRVCHCCYTRWAAHWEKLNANKEHKAVVIPTWPSLEIYNGDLD